MIDPKPAVPKGSAPRVSKSRGRGGPRNRGGPSGQHGKMDSEEIKTRKVFVGGLSPDTTEEILKVSSRVVHMPLAVFV